MVVKSTLIDLLDKIGVQMYWKLTTNDFYVCTMSNSLFTQYAFFNDYFIYFFKKEQDLVHKITRSTSKY